MQTDGKVKFSHSVLVKIFFVQNSIHILTGGACLDWR